jgi:hypothetical protein
MMLHAAGVTGGLCGALGVLDSRDFDFVRHDGRATIQLENRVVYLLPTRRGGKVPRITRKKEEVSGKGTHMYLNLKRSGVRHAT